MLENNNSIISDRDFFRELRETLASERMINPENRIIEIIENISKYMMIFTILIFFFLFLYFIIIPIIFSLFERIERKKKIFLNSNY